MSAIKLTVYARRHIARTVSSTGELPEYESSRTSQYKSAIWLKPAQVRIEQTAVVEARIYQGGRKAKIAEAIASQR
jgi:hypothetical protein